MFKVGEKRSIVCYYTYEQKMNREDFTYCYAPS